MRQLNTSVFVSVVTSSDVDDKRWKIAPVFFILPLDRWIYQGSQTRFTFQTLTCRRHPFKMKCTRAPKSTCTSSLCVSNLKETTVEGPFTNQTLEAKSKTSGFCYCSRSTGKMSLLLTYEKEEEVRTHPGDVTWFFRAWDPKIPIIPLRVTWEPSFNTTPSFLAG